MFSFFLPKDLSLYSTATQNTWRQGLRLGNAPDARILRWGYQHVGILEPTKTLKFESPPTPTPDASQWNIGGVGSSGVDHVYFMYISCIFHVVCAPFSALATRVLADANPVSSGIWALDNKTAVWVISYVTVSEPIYTLFLFLRFGGHQKGEGGDGHPWNSRHPHWIYRSIPLRIDTSGLPPL